LFGPVVDCLTAFAGKEQWIEKTPEHVYYLGQLLRHLPNAKVVELVRDPRATLASRKLRRTGDEWLDAKEEKELLEVDRATNYDPILDSMMWKEAVNAARDVRRGRPQNILTVRYEDLAGNPAETLRRICEFTGLAYSDDLLDVGWVNSATQMKEHGSTAAVPKAGVSTAAVEKWRKTLSAEETFLCQSLLKSEMRELGYESAQTSLGARIKAPFLAVGTAVNLARRMGNDRQSPERARDAFGRIQRRLLKNLGIQR
jgi:Sulfotransferase family